MNAFILPRTAPAFGAARVTCGIAGALLAIIGLIMLAISAAGFINAPACCDPAALAVESLLLAVMAAAALTGAASGMSVALQR